MKKYFTKTLLDWHYNHNTRSLPWKEEKQPYKIWLSEIILQQTRAQQGLPYYLKFIEAFPTVQTLAKAKDEKVFKLWEGLGYYNRCKNMLVTARYITNELSGKFPDTYEGLLALKGIGPYTAAAIASFAYNLPHAVVDGNVYRVLSRYFGIDTAIDSTAGKKLFTALANEQLDKKDSAGYNQAIMDLGATVCNPQRPDCGQCPLQKNCVAHQQNLIDLLPVKTKKVQVRKRYFHYLVLHAENNIWIRKRPAGDIWENLYEPYLIEDVQPLDIQHIKKHVLYKKAALNGSNIKYEGSTRQRLTHQDIESSFFEIQLKNRVKMPIKGGKWVKISELKKIAFPKTVLSFLENNFYF